MGRAEPDGASPRICDVVTAHSKSNHACCLSMASNAAAKRCKHCLRALVLLSAATVETHAMKRRSALRVESDKEAAVNLAKQLRLERVEQTAPKKSGNPLIAAATSAGEAESTLAAAANATLVTISASVGIDTLPATTPASSNWQNELGLVDDVVCATAHKYSLL